MANTDGEHSIIWDAALLIRLRDGNAAAFDMLVRSFGAALIRHAAHIVNSVDVAQDVVQEVFFSVWQNRSRIEPNWDITSYLFGLTRRRSIDVARSRSSSSERESNWIAQKDMESDSAPQSPDFITEQEDLRREVWAALSGVSSRCRDVFMMVWDHQVSYREIAERTGLTEQTVRIYASRAMRRLADVLGPKYRP